MALRDILLDGDPALRRKARLVDRIDERIFMLLDDMLETMRNADGVGLAAPQVAVRRRVVIVDVGEGLFELINPGVVSIHGEQCNEEGCLSIPGVSGYVKRPERVVVRAQNRAGEWVEYEGSGYLAVAMCHEIDHLDGILFTDKMLELSEEELAALRKRDEERAR